MAAPWLNTTTRPPGWAAAMRSTARRRRPPNTSRDSAPGITSQRCSASTCSNTGSPSADFMRRRPPSHSPRKTSRRSASTTGVMPVRATSGAAVWAVRCRVVTYSASKGSWARRRPTCSAWWRPASESGGSPWPSTSSKVSPSSESADAPWRTSQQLGGAGRADIGPLAEAAAGDVTGAECRERSSAGACSSGGPWSSSSSTTSASMMLGSSANARRRARGACPDRLDPDPAPSPRPSARRHATRPTEAGEEGARTPG